MTLIEVFEKGMEKRPILFEKTASTGRNQIMKITDEWSLVGIASPENGGVQDIHFIHRSGHQEEFFDFMLIAQQSK